MKSDDPWEAALEIGELRDKNMIESMKDDLNNLLVFVSACPSSLQTIH